MTGAAVVAPSVRRYGGTIHVHPPKTWVRLSCLCFCAVTDSHLTLAASRCQHCQSTLPALLAWWQRLSAWAARLCEWLRALPPLARLHSASGQTAKVWGGGLAQQGSCAHWRDITSLIPQLHLPSVCLKRLGEAPIEKRCQRRPSPTLHEAD